MQALGSWGAAWIWPGGSSESDVFPTGQGKGGGGGKYEVQLKRTLTWAR